MPTLAARTTAVLALLALVPCLAQAAYRSTFIEKTKAWGSVVADFNNDGRQDIFITGHQFDDRLWYWDGASARFVPSAQILEWVDRHDCDAADVNRDGRMDMYCAVGAEKGQGQGPKQLYMQQPDGSLRLAENHGAEDPYGRGRIPVFFDFNRDGYPDIYLTNEHVGRTDGNLNHNQVFVNAGDGTARFTPVTTLATGPNGWGCAAKGDVNGDGWDDLLVCHPNGPPQVYINDQAGNFRALSAPALASKWKQAKLADINGDGRHDLVLLTNNELQVWVNSGQGAFFETLSFSNKFIMLAKALTIGDFNRDGRQDIYVVLQQSTCKDTGQDTAHDMMFHGRSDGGFTKIKMPETYAGCGYLADTVDGDKVLLMNGDVGTRGPNYIIEWMPSGK